jgi:hypothetical protein
LGQEQRKLPGVLMHSALPEQGLVPSRHSFCSQPKQFLTVIEQKAQVVLVFKAGILPIQ